LTADSYVAFYAHSGFSEIFVIGETFFEARSAQTSLLSSLTRATFRAHNILSFVITTKGIVHLRLALCTSLVLALNLYLFWLLITAVDFGEDDLFLLWDRE
jgi:hypothetical protein